MNTYTAEKRRTRRTGYSKVWVGWEYGHTHAQATLSREVWCVCLNGRVIAEAKGKKKAELIADSLNVAGIES